MEFRNKMVLRTFCSLVGIVIAWPAYAYIDPGTATIALQAVIGAIAVAGIFFREKLFQFLALFRKQPKTKEQNTDSEHASPR